MLIGRGAQWEVLGQSVLGPVGSGQQLVHVGPQGPVRERVGAQVLVLVWSVQQVPVQSWALLVQLVQSLLLDRDLV